MAAVGIAALLPAIIYGVPVGSVADQPHHYRLALPFYEAVRSGVVYPGWLAESTGGYGDVSFRFYPPATYYLLALTRTLAGNWYSGSLIAFALLSMTGGLGVYTWARAFLPPKLAVWAGVFFTLMPYHVNEIYQAFMLPEYAGCAVLPFAFAFVERVCRVGRTRHIAGLAIAYAVLILTHLPLTVIGSLALLVYALLRLDKNNLWPTLMRLTLGVMLGLAASAFYWTTLVTELSWIGANNAHPDPWYDYHFNFLFWKSVEGAPNWWANILAIATFIMILPALAISRRALKGRINRGVFAVILLTLVSVFMMLPVSLPVWKVVPMLKEVQFPWRWLTVTSMAGSVALAASIPYWIEKARSKYRPLALIAAGSVLITLTFTLSQPLRDAKYFTRTEFQAFLQTIPGSAALAYWLPVWASDQPRKMDHEVEAANRSCTIESWQPEERLFNVEAGAQTEARVRTFYYPHWVALADGRQLETRPAEDGALLIKLPAQAVSVKLKFEEPARTRYAAACAAFGWTLILALFIFNPRILRRT
ncbi:MAG: 6-pyruvoyl-tetrahydropterin synthase-related protein [Pyrinomonadaceae bacterium]